MRKYYVTYEANRNMYIATRKPKPGIAFVKFKTMHAAKLFRNKVKNEGS